MTFADHILSFNASLNFKEKLPDHISILNPFRDIYTSDLCSQFYRKYYNDTDKRTLILGINPGRFGAGLTGIPFTDPIKLEAICGISNTLDKKPELSAAFVYEVIHAYGGLQKFYSSFYINSVFPLGFVKDGKNINYYDNKKLELQIRSQSAAYIKTQLGFGITRQICFCLGEGKNYGFLQKLNEEYHFFENIIPLPHPRFIMQYKLKQKEHYLKLYLEKLAVPGRHE